MKKVSTLSVASMFAAGTLMTSASPTLNNEAYKVTTMVSSETINTPVLPVYETAERTLPPHLLSGNNNTLTPQAGERPLFRTLLNRTDIRKIAADGEKKFQLDSLVRISLGGQKYVKQSFNYSADGKPAKATNYLYDESLNDWNEAGYSLIEYDSYGRAIVKEQYDETGQMENVRYEYVYTGDNDWFSMETFFYFDNGKWVPSQRGEYDYDSNGNCTLQMLYGLDDKTGEWTYGMKITSAYDSDNNLTAYHEYLYDSESNQWVGYNEAKTYEYDTSGRPVNVFSYCWENNDWLKFEHRALTYDERGNCTLDEYLYWNRQKQDWSGGDEYGEYGFVENNRKIVSLYDNDGQLTEQLVYRKPADEYVLISKETRQYSFAENGERVVAISQNMPWESPDPTPYTETVYHYNQLGIETYYKKGNYYQVPGKLTYITEEVHPTDEFGNVLYTYYYGFKWDEENSRYGEAHEVFEYVPGNNPATGYLNRIGNNIYMGTSKDSDDSWQYSQYYGWTYADNDVNTGQMLYAIVNDEKVPSSGFELEYDFDVPFESLVFWPIGNKRDSFYTYQTIRETTLVNNDYYLGVVNFDPEESYSDNFYYSKWINTDVENTFTQTREEVARYDISGRRIEKGVKGVNIVKYSDGSVEKIMAR